MGVGELRQDFQDKRVPICMSMVKKIVAIKSGGGDDFEMEAIELAG